MQTNKPFNGFVAGTKPLKGFVPHDFFFSAMQWRHDDDPIDQPLPDVMRLHFDDKSIEMISDDDLDIRSLPQIMKLHIHSKPDRQFNQQQHYEDRSDERRNAHVRNQLKKFEILD